MAQTRREADLYPPVKAYLEGLGYGVRAEVGKCDAVGLRADEGGETLIAVELKLVFGLSVLYQALDRLSAVDFVYVAVDVPEGKIARRNWDNNLADATRLCRMLGVGFLSVRDGAVVVHCDPTAYEPRKQPRRRARLLGEFGGRTGDHNVGGTTKRPRISAYREGCLRIAALLAETGTITPAGAKAATNVAKASTMLLRDVYGWFENVSRGVYRLRPAGRDALATYAEVVALHREQALPALSATRTVRSKRRRGKAAVPKVTGIKSARGKTQAVQALSMPLAA